jgi:hypothetical protein
MAQARFGWAPVKTWLKVPDGGEPTLLRFPEHTMDWLAPEMPHAHPSPTASTEGVTTKAMQLPP